MMFVTWWLDLLRSGWIGALTALWIAATVIPMVAYALVASVAHARVAIRRVTAVASAKAPPRVALPPRLEDAA